MFLEKSRKRKNPGAKGTSQRIAEGGSLNKKVTKFLKTIYLERSKKRKQEMGKIIDRGRRCLYKK